jgi:6-phosphogluconolactonase
VSDQITNFVYVGNWDRTKTPTKGSFHLHRYDPESGAIELLRSVMPGIRVGATCIDGKRNVLYCTDEDSTHHGYQLGGGGLVYALRIDPESGDLTEINHQPSYGTSPTYCVVDSSGDYLLVVHHTGAAPVTHTITDAAGKYEIALEYDAATIVLFPLGQDGSIDEPCDIYTATGDGGPLSIQTHPQLHSVTMSPSGELFAVCDKGCDRIITLNINRKASKLRVLESQDTIPGASPRYSAFHPSRPFLFVNYEMKAVVSAFRYDAGGNLDLICTVDSLPAGCEDDPDMKQSDLKVDAKGKYLYDLIRGFDAITVFAIDQDSGIIENIQTIKIEGIMPRGCAFSPDGRFLVVTAQMSDEVLVWAIGDDGRLSPTGLRSGLPEQSRPGAVAFFPAATQA